MNHAKPGFVLILTILISAFCMVLITSIMQRAFMFGRQTNIYLDRQRARTVVLGSLELVKDQISYIEKKEDKKADQKNAAAAKQSGQSSDQKTDPKAEKDAARKAWVKKLLEICNTWQTIALSDEKSGIVATIELFVTCEQGKLNLRQVMDAIMQMHKQKELEKKKQEQLDSKNGQKKPADPKAKQEAKKEDQGEDAKKPKPFAVELNELMLKEANVNLIKVLEDFQKQKGHVPEHATDLVVIPEFKALKNLLFVDMPAKGAAQKIYAMDLFTTASGSGRLNPWLLSQSLAKLIGLTSGRAKDVSQLMSKFKDSMQWAKDFDAVLAPVYGKKFETLPKQLTALFGPQFEATGFSVIAIARVGNAVERIYALFEPDQSDQSANKVFRVAKVYWL